MNKLHIMWTPINEKEIRKQNKRNKREEKKEKERKKNKKTEIIKKEITE